MIIRNAKIQDVPAICSLINYYAEQDIMLFRSRADVYENLQDFFVAEDGSEIVGCCSLAIIWADLAEVKSLAVEQSRKKSGIGARLVNAVIERASEIGLPKVFALTLTPGFFEKLGFSIVEKDEMPMKVWSDCARCPKQDHCDEIAVLRKL